MSQITNTPTDSLIENINGLTEWIKQSADAVGHFAQTQTPLYVQEYINWYFWNSAINAVFWAIILFICTAVAVWGFTSLRRSQSKRKSYVQWWPFPAVVGSVLVLVISVAVIDQSKEAIKAKVAPRVILLDQAAKIVYRLK